MAEVFREKDTTPRRHASWIHFILRLDVIQGDFYNWPPCSVPNKMPRSQPELPLHENLHLNEGLVDHLAFYHFGAEEGERGS